MIATLVQPHQLLRNSPSTTSFTNVLAPVLLSRGNCCPATLKVLEAGGLECIPELLRIAWRHWQWQGGAPELLAKLVNKNPITIMISRWYLYSWWDFKPFITGTTLWKGGTMWDHVGPCGTMRDLWRSSGALRGGLWSTSSMVSTWCISTRTALSTGSHNLGYK